jgi:predicted nucleic-acid-binding protein
MHAVDTNVLVRLITQDDPKQASVAEAYIARGAWVSHLVLVETMWVLTSVYDIAPKGIATAVEMLLNHEHLSIQDPDVVTAALSHFRRKPSLGFSDCMVLETARKAGHLPLGTFDNNLGKLDGARGL